MKRRRLLHPYPAAVPFGFAFQAPGTVPLFRAGAKTHPVLVTGTRTGGGSPPPPPLSSQGGRRGAAPRHSAPARGRQTAEHPAAAAASPSPGIPSTPLRPSPRDLQRSPPFTQGFTALNACERRRFSASEDGHRKAGRGEGARRPPAEVASA